MMDKTWGVICVWYDLDFIQPTQASSREREPQIVNYDPGYFEQFKEPCGIKI